ncbi:hypothetical protein HTV80_12955 [Streptomyces sp. Vc74B-19]|uniref:hypothetical protein n=1 Tax=Streptomyces sp. Vc74B-19 TaxID=2741324 RepID=UPI001BFCABD7|nr:hypothetical protein [Streptomyces sp. Vc74B-19]MBT3164019.1 hypothetical protein [Streptomyces sp. Vc74B-19]
MPPRRLACPGCPGARKFGHYLCPACWAALPRAARQALSRHDPHAHARLRQLLDQLTAGIPPHRIEIST